MLLKFALSLFLLLFTAATTAATATAATTKTAATARAVITTVAAVAAVAAVTAIAWLLLLLLLLLLLTRSRCQRSFHAIVVGLLSLLPGVVATAAVALLTAAAHPITKQQQW